MQKRIVIGADHAGYELKEVLKNFLEKHGWKVMDVGTHSDDSTDYPDYAHPLAEEVSEDDDSLGILICGSANGVSMTANKHQKIRAGIAWNEEVAELARTHNNANVLSLPARYIDVEQAKRIVESFLQAEFEGGRHERRVNKINIT